MFNKRYINFIIIIVYSINFFITLALAALNYCLIKVEKKRLSHFCWVLKGQIWLNICISTLLFIFQPIMLFPIFAGFSMNPICNLIPYCARVNLSFLLLLLLHFPIFFISSTLFQLSRVRLTLNELIDYQKRYAFNQHRKVCILSATAIIEIFTLVSFICLIIFGSLSRFETSTLLTANGFQEYIRYLPYGFNSSTTVYIIVGIISAFFISTIFGIFTLFNRVKTTLTEFRVVGSPGLHFQCKLLKIIFYQLILGNAFLFIPLIISIIFVLIVWEYSALLASLIFIWISFYPVLSCASILFLTPHFWERIALIFKPLYSPPPNSIVSTTNSTGFFEVYQTHIQRQQQQQQQQFRY